MKTYGKVAVEYRKTDSLIPYARNPRKNDDAAQKLAGVIAEFGFTVPVIIRSNGEIIDGHARLKAAQILKLDEVPVIVNDEWTEAQAKAFRLAVNKSAEWAEWDDELLKLELDELKLEDFDLELIGFDDVLQDVPAEGMTDADEVPEVQEQTISRNGDIWLLGKHRLMCGDSTDAGSVALLMAGEKAKILFTSPPYSNLRTYKGGNLEVDHLVNFIPAYKPYVEYQLVNLGIQIQNREIVQYWDEYIKAAKAVGYKLMAWMVWDKMSVGSVGQQKHFVPTRHEFIFCFGNDAQELNKTIPKQKDSINKKAKFNIGRQPDGTMKYSTMGDTSNPNKTIESIVSISTQQDRFKDHPAPFPVGLPAEFIKAFTDEGDIVAEPFSGSGTMIIAAEKNGRSCYGMELAPQYVDCSIRRWQDFTGQDATLEGDGRTFAEIEQERESGIL